MLISSTNNYPIGLDISDLSLKLVQFKKNRDKIAIQALARTNLEPGLIENGLIKNEKKIVDIITNLLAKPGYGNFDTTEVVAALPEAHSFIKLIEIENTPNDLADIIPTEIEKHFPLSIKEVFYDWQQIHKSSDSQNILIGAATKNIVNQYVNILASAKLSVLALENESLPICRALLKEETPKFNGEFNQNYCIIDIGAKQTNMVIYSKKTIVLSISLPISGESVTEKIAKTLEIKRDDAEKAKILCGLDQTQADGIIKDILSEMIKSLTKKMNEAINFYYKHYPDFGPINKIILSGGGSNIKYLDQAISSSLKIKTSSAQALINLNNENLEKTFQKLFVAKNASPVIQNSTLGFTTAIGLALKTLFNNS